MRRSPLVAQPPASDAGVVFRLIDGRRSSMATGQCIIATSTQRVDTAIHESARDEPDWRANYIHHFREVTRLSAQQHALLIAADGLASVDQQFRSRRHDTELSLTEALAIPRSNYLSSWSTAGGGVRRERELVVPYQGHSLRGDQLRHLTAEWLDLGIAEPSCAAAIEAVIDNPDWLDLSDTTVVVLGAGAEIGPYQPLLRWGAHVVAVDLPDPAIWRRLIHLARTSSGSLTLPVRRPLSSDAPDEQVALHAGTDIITEAPELTAWLTNLAGPYVLGDYVYAPGSTHVRSSVAIDAIIKQLLERRSDIGLAYLATPTDAYAVPSDVVEHSRHNLAASGAFVTATQGLSGRRLYRANYPTIESTTNGLRFGIADALVPQQGPNYALAKRIQRWRAQCARAHGAFVSINVAPATRTRSVTRNRILSAAYSGAHRFGLEIFEPQTSSTVMAALLVHDMRNRSSSAHADVALDEEFDFLADGALHGGMWRAPFAPRSVLGVAVAMGMISRS